MVVISCDENIHLLFRSVMQKKCCVLPSATPSVKMDHMIFVRLTFLENSAFFSTSKKALTCMDFWVKRTAPISWTITFE